MAGEDAYQLHHAAGKILNDLKAYDEAMEQISLAKRSAGFDFDIEAYRAWVGSMIGMFPHSLRDGRGDFGNPSPAPVFIVGMPRSGTTLVEQICASHPAVHGAGELYTMARLATSLGLNRIRSSRSETLSLL